MFLMVVLEKVFVKDPRNVSVAVNEVKITAKNY